MSAPVPAGTLALPWAARAQGLLGLPDFALTGRARLRHPRVVWWWGKRPLLGRPGAYCYLHDGWIGPLGSNRAPSRRALDRILRHRETEYGRPLPRLGIPAPADPAGADASPQGGQR